MIRVSPALALVAPVLLLASACVDSPTAPSRRQLAPTPEPSPGLFTPLLLPPGADWGHYFNSFNPDRHLSAYVIHYPDGTVTGKGIFIVPGLGIGRLRVTTLVSTSQECVPWGTPCSDPGATNIPEGSTVSGDGTIGLVPITFTLELESHLWPPQGWIPGSDPGTNYDIARLTTCTTPTTCTTTTFHGELHHEPT